MLNRTIYKSAVKKIGIYKNNMKENFFDIIILGTGCAGFSLALQLAKDNFFAEKKILLLDKSDKKLNDRTWCFWADSAFGYDEIISGKWQKMLVCDKKKQLSLQLKELCYMMIRGEDFYAFAKKKLSEKNNFSFHQAEVLKLENNKVELLGGEIFFSDFIFDSRPVSGLSVKKKDYLYIHQHFKGWFIRTPEPIFDAEKITLFDFRCAQGRDLRFFYLLPTSPSEALVEFTIFGEELWKNEAYENELKKYLTQTLGIKNFTIQEEETGVIPMTNYHFKRHEGKHIFRIGTAGGMGKASTGYAFYFIQKDCQKIIHFLKKGQFPPEISFFARRFWLYDSMLLNIFVKNLLPPSALFMQLFERNDTTSLLRFLINETNFWEELRVMNSVPPLPFLRSLLQLFVK
jgi:lycopene beta-cyclase